ncbi:MAG: hypothetical protein ACKN9E_00980 [Microcystaceae cyanobacterium]|nr:hypothetical protein [Merismopediaceae bacterium]
MQVTRNNQPLTPEEQEELGRLKVMVEKAIADGILSKTEEDMIRSAVLSHHGTHELYYQELQMCRELITEKVNQGLLVAETYDSL